MAAARRKLDLSVRKTDKQEPRMCKEMTKVLPYKLCTDKW